MARRWSRRAFLGVLATTAGCAGGGSQPSSTPTNQAPENTDRRTPAETTTQATSSPESPPTTESVEVRTWPDEYYQGPLVSAHEHMQGRDGYSVIMEDIEWYVRWMDRNKVDQVIGFASDQYMGKLTARDDHFLPFASGWNELRNNYGHLPSAFEYRLDSWPYVGIGELGFKPSVTPTGEGPPQPDDPEALDLWDMAADRGLPVMVHASEPSRYPDEMRAGWDEFADCPTKESMANAMAHNRDTQFLVHNTYHWHGTPRGQLVAEALANHPNLTYDITNNMLNRMAYGAGTFTEDEFTSRIQDLGGPETIAQQFYDEYEVILEDYSHRLTWGMDAAVEWHYTDWALNTWVDACRALLGMLPEENARNIGYRTVADLMDIEITASD